jgi:hypothetical protein
MTKAKPSTKDDARLGVTFRMTLAQRKRLRIMALNRGVTLQALIEDVVVRELLRGAKA